MKLVGWDSPSVAGQSSEDSGGGARNYNQGHIKKIQEGNFRKSYKFELKLKKNRIKIIVFKSSGGTSDPLDSR